MELTDNERIHSQPTEDSPLPVLWRTVGPTCLYLVNMDSLTDRLAAYRSVLSTDEMVRAERYHSDVHRNRYIIARGALRFLLSERAAEEPKAIQFEYGTHGKPSASGCPPFNLSHSRNLALFAIGAAYELGVDIEWQDPATEIESIAHRFFTKAECAAIQALSTIRERQQLFFRFWSCKEAYLKAIGTGISAGLNTCQIVTESDGTVRIANPSSADEHSRWRIHLLDMDGQFSAALCQDSREHLPQNDQSG